MVKRMSTRAKGDSLVVLASPSISEVKGSSLTPCKRLHLTLKNKIKEDECKKEIKYGKIYGWK